MKTWLGKIRLWEISLAVFLGFGCYFIWSSIQSEKQITVQASGVLSHVDSTVTQIGTAFTSAATSISQTEKDVATVTKPAVKVVAGLQQTVAIINHPCVPGPCGTLYDVAKTLNTARGVFGQIEVAVNHEDKNLTVLDQQETQLFEDTHKILTGFVPLQNEIDKTIFDFDALATSPDLNQTIHNFGVVTDNLGDMTGDAKTKFHEFLFPTPCTNFKCRLLKGIKFVTDASQLLEPAYYGWSLIKGMP